MAVDPSTCEVLQGIEPGSSEALLAQYECLRASITDGLVPALSQIRSQIIENAEEIKRLQDAEMLGLVVGEGQQMPPGILATGWPSYSIAFVCLCVAIAVFVIASGVVAVRKLGANARVIGGVTTVSLLFIGLVIALMQRYL